MHFFNGTLADLLKHWDASAMLQFQTSALILAIGIKEQGFLPTVEFQIPYCPLHTFEGELSLLHRSWTRRNMKGNPNGTNPNSKISYKQTNLEGVA
nr:hypothetical protein CFP56_24961 [Quercus suber]